MIEAPGAGANQSPWWYRNRSTVFGILYGAGFLVPDIVNGFTHSQYVPTFLLLGRKLGGDPAIVLLFCLSPALVFLCFAIRLWGSSYLRAAIVWNANAKAERLFVEGPFRYTRNPLYFGNLFMALGFALIAPPIGAIIIIIGNVFIINALIAHEEPLLRATFGEAYERYCANVPRLWPRLQPVAAEGSLKLDLGQGMAAETWTLSLFIGLCCFFAPWPYGLYGFITCYVLGIVAQRVLVRRIA